jgi:hypothetical protein
MKKIFSFFLVILIVKISIAQQQNFDITTFTPPKGWKKQTTESTIQFTKEDATKGTYCIIMLFKALPGTANSKTNFDAAWETVVKEAVTVTAAPEMQTPATENGWEAQSGFAPFESDGSNGIALLVTSTGFEKMVNILVLTNSDVYEKEMSAFLESVSFKKIIAAPNKPINNQEKPAIKPTVTTNAPKEDGFAYNTTNFDDGWISTAQADWVETKKGNTKVYIHYPKEGTIFPADPDPLTTAAWNILVAPRYSNLKDYKTTYITTYDRPYLGMGTATENASGKQVFIVLFRQGQTGWLEFVTPDKNTFIQQFRFDPEMIRWDSESELMRPLAAMVGYNKFAVAASDFTGTWTSSFSGMQQLYHVYSGNYAGMNINQSNEEFTFNTAGTYNWKLLVVNGMVGNMNYNQVKSTGKLTVLNNWQVNCSSIEGKPKKYYAHFSCIKGARLLHLLDAQYPGSGIPTVFGKK